MVEVLDIVANVAVLIFVVTCMTTAGLGLAPHEILAPLRQTRLLVAAIVANFVLVPFVAVALTRLVTLDQSHAIGLLLLGTAAGAPFLPKLASIARGDLAYSVSLMLLLMVGSVIFMPIALPFLIPGLSAKPWPLLRPLLFTMLLPLALGIAIHSRSPRWSARLRSASATVSNVSMIIAVLLLFGLNLNDMLSTLGSGAILVSLLFVTVSFAIGYAMGGPSPNTRSVLGLGTGQRNIAAALVLATQNFPEPGVVVMILIASFAGLGVLLFASQWSARRSFNRAIHVEQRDDSTDTLIRDKSSFPTDPS